MAEKKEDLKVEDIPKELIAEEELKISEKGAGISGIIGWNPKTKLGMEVKDGKIKSIDEILDAEKKIM